MICKSPDNFLFFCCEFCFFESPLRFEVKHNCGRRKKIRQHLGSNIGGFPLFALFVFCYEFCFLKSPLRFEVKHNYGCRKKIRQHLGITIGFSLFALLVFCWEFGFRKSPLGFEVNIIMVVDRKLD
jgi:hypothetical protein